MAVLFVPATPPTSKSDDLAAVADSANSEEALKAANPLAVLDHTPHLLVQLDVEVSVLPVDDHRPFLPTLEIHRY